MKIGNYNLQTIIVPFMDTNCYVVYDDKDAMLVDAAGDGEVLIDFLENSNLNLTAVLITHGHFDHIEALDALHEKYKNAKIYVSSSEMEVVNDKNKNLMSHELRGDTLTAINYVDFANNNTLDISLNDKNLHIEVIETPGHTIGSVCYYIRELGILFSGDTMFKDTYGRCDLPTGDMKSIAKSVGIKLMELDDETMVYPGHGAPTNIGYERKNNEITREYVVNWAKSQ